MVVIDIPSISKKDVFIGDDITSTFTLSNHPVDIHVYISGLYLTEDEDYTITGNQIEFFEAPLLNENINILYKV